MKSLEEGVINMAMAKGIVFFDCDGVLTTTRSSWKLLHEYFGSIDNKYFAELYRKGLISYLDWMKIDVALMIHSYGKPIKRHEVEEALSKIDIREDAYDAVNRIKNMGLIVAVVSSGIGLLVKRVCREMGIDICLYNELLFVDDELIPGGNPRVPPDKKDEIIEEIANSLNIDMEKTVYIGDSSWDIPIFKKVGLGIALKPCDDDARIHADYVVDRLSEIPGIIESRFLS